MVHTYANCSSLESVTIGNSVINLQPYVFENCSSLESVTIGNSVRYIATFAFRNCSSLTSITIPSSVTTVGGGFTGCSSLTSITSLNLLPPSSFNSALGFTGEQYASISLYVPEAAIEAYKTADLWKRFNNILPLVAVQSIAFVEQSHNMTVGETYQIQYRVTPEDATYQVINWSSENDNVVKVDANGVMTAVGAGTTTVKAITADGSNVSASYTVTVTKKAVESVTFTEQTHWMTVGDSYQISYAITPEDATYQTLIWSSSNESVVIVDDKGMVSGIGAGRATVKAIAADDSSQYAECIINVVDAAWTKITEYNFANVANGSDIMIYPYGKGKTINLSLSSNAADATLTSVEKAGKGGDIWTLEDAGGGYVYIVNSLGQYWAYQQSNENSVPMTVMTDKSSAVKVKLVWNEKYPGVAFQNANDDTYLNNLFGYNYRYNWYNGEGDPLIFDTNSTYDVYLKNVRLNCIYFDADEMTLENNTAKTASSR